MRTIPCNPNAQPEVKEVLEYLSQIEYVNIYIDEWSRFGLNFVGIFCSSIEKDFLLACGIPDSIFRNALCLSEYIKKQISEFKINEKILLKSNLDLFKYSINRIFRL